MGLKKIVKHLHKLLDTGEDLKAKRTKAVKKLVNKLEYKEAAFERKLSEAKSDKDIKKARRHLKVCQAQLEKGRVALQELQENAG